MNGQSIGLTSGGDFMVASRWDPAAIGPYDGMELTKVNFFPCCDQSSYTIKVWTGANAANLVYEQVLTTIVVDTWNEITLDTPVVINAADEFWFGYAIVGQPAGTHPAGCDIGPAVAGYGDMISMDGVTWDSLAGLGLDYNWNLQGYVVGSDGEAIAINPTPRVQTSTVRTQRLSQNSPFSCSPFVKRVNELPARDSRSLSGYKVYRDGLEIEEITDPLILTYLDDEGLDAGDYEYYVTAIYTDPAGESEASNLAPITITLPAPVNATAVCENPPSVVVEWELPPMPVRGLSHYKVYRDDVEIADNVNNLFYIDTEAEAGERTYNVTAVYDVGWESEFSNDAVVIVVGTDGLSIPLITELTGNYPNPFNPETNISFSVKEAGKVTLEIYNIKGEKVRTLVKGHREAAYYNVTWNGKDNSGKQVASGVYFYKMKTGKYVSTKKMILMK
ncbi:MAG: T9SS type A sorting domain-containing protein, partial [Candidatus Cloacimonetes bacterium]|nr:T9SS type A sorting domain-containing protein [Candidatus Cloacimonadota bacterium]